MTSNIQMELPLHTIHEEITLYLDKLGFELKKFTVLLKFERDSLLDRDYDSIQEATEEKMFILKNIQSVDKALKSVFHDNDQETTLQDYITSMADDSVIKKQWLEKMHLLDKCNELNAANKKMVDQHINDVHSIIDIIDTNNEQANMYNKSGFKINDTKTSISYSHRI